MFGGLLSKLKKFDRSPTDDSPTHCELPVLDYFHYNFSFLRQ